MKTTNRSILMACALLALPCACKNEEPARAVAKEAPLTNEDRSATSIHKLTMNRLDGTPESLGSWAGKVVLVVNTASECGYTPQYEGLEKLHEKYQARGFAVLGFPSNDFGGQEPGSAAEIATFCRTKYGVKFPMFEKVKTVGDARAPLYALLSSSKGPPKWNFHKYLVGKDGVPVKAWPSSVPPESPEIADAIEAEIAR